MKKIIILDDYKDFADSVRQYVENSTKQETNAFYDPEKVLEHIDKVKDIDILITDYQMPKMNGFELAKKVIERFPNIKIIIWSGHDESTLKKVNNEYNLDVTLLSKSQIGKLINFISACY